VLPLFLDGLCVIIFGFIKFAIINKKSASTKDKDVALIVAKP
jgi:hypothetical protein